MLPRASSAALRRLYLRRSPVIPRRSSLFPSWHNHQFLSITCHRHYHLQLHARDNDDPPTPPIPNFPPSESRKSAPQSTLTNIHIERFRDKLAKQLPEDFPTPEFRLESSQDSVTCTLSLKLPANTYRISDTQIIRNTDGQEAYHAIKNVCSRARISLLQNTPFCSSIFERCLENDVIVLSFKRSWAEKIKEVPIPIVHYERGARGRTWKCMMHVQLSDGKEHESEAEDKKLFTALGKARFQLLSTLRLANYLSTDTAVEKDTPLEVVPLQWKPTPAMVLTMASTSEEYLRHHRSHRFPHDIDMGKGISPYFKTRDESPSQSSPRSKRLLEQHEAFHASDVTERLRQARSSLPIRQSREDICDMITNNTYSIVVGTTGSGKTTQVPQMILEEAILKGNGSSVEIFCTQPRRIAAQSVAARVAAERHEKIQTTVGYQIKGDAKCPLEPGSITFCTTGILLARLRYHPEETMDHMTHIIIDEVHERDSKIDTLMMILKKLVESRKQKNQRVPKIVLMSATLDVKLFSEYFSQVKSDGTKQSCPSISVEGRTFPVDEFFLEDIIKSMSRRLLDIVTSKDGLRNERDTYKYLWKEVDMVKYSPSVVPGLQSSGNAPLETEPLAIKTPTLLAAAAIAHVVETTRRGAILVFLPGIREITEVGDFLSLLLDTSQFEIHFLHSDLRGSINNVFAPPRGNRRKIILATNIAETSITIPDIKFVIDSGLARLPGFDQFAGASQLRNSWIGKVNSKQRAGRAGRVSHGQYYALFSKARWDSFRNSGLPEIHGIDLQQTAMDIKARFAGDSIAKILAEVIEPPRPEVVEAAIQDLKQLEAITENEEFTPLGKLLIKFPDVHPSIGKMLLFGIIFRCFDPMLILASAQSGSPLFRKGETPWADPHSIAKRLAFSEGSGSDPITTINAFEFARAEKAHGRGFMDAMAASYLDPFQFESMEENLKNIKGYLEQFGLVPRQNSPDAQDFYKKHNENSRNLPLIKGLLLATYPDHIAWRKKLVSFSAAGKSALIKNSVNDPTNLKKPERIRQQAADTLLYSYGPPEKSNDRDTDLILKDTTRQSPFAVALFGHDANIVRNKGREKLLIDKWLSFDVTVEGNQSPKTTSEALKTLMAFRQAIDMMLSNAFASLAVGGYRHPYLRQDQTVAKLISAVARVLKMDVGLSRPVRPQLAGFDWDLWWDITDDGRSEGDKGERVLGDSVPEDDL